MATLLQDSFTDTTGTALSSHTMNTGGGWTTSGTWTVQSNTAKNSADSGDVQAWADAGQADVTYTVDYTIPASGSWNGGVIANVSDANNYWLFDVNDGGVGGVYLLYEKNGGSYTQRASLNESLTRGTPVTLKVVTSGDTITCYVNNVQKLTYTVGSRPFKTATKFGFRRASAGGATPTWDNFLVVTSGGTTLAGWHYLRHVAGLGA